MVLKSELMKYVKWPDLESALETGSIDESKEKSISELHGETGSQNDSGQHLSYSSSHPSPQVLHKLGELGGLSKSHWILKEDVEKIKVKL